MAQIFLWIGLTIILSLPLLGFNTFAVVGAVIMIIGCILLILSK